MYIINITKNIAADMIHLGEVKVRIQALIEPRADVHFDIGGYRFNPHVISYDVARQEFYVTCYYGDWNTPENAYEAAQDMKQTLSDMPNVLSVSHNVSPPELTQKSISPAPRFSLFGRRSISKAETTG
jgi:hypothetical protein